MPKKRTPDLTVEDHGNGYMVIGTNHIHVAREELKDYFCDVNTYRFAAVINYNGQPAVWLSVGPADHWDGATDHIGQPLRRY